jgi:hypothetical protein
MSSIEDDKNEKSCSLTWEHSISDFSAAREISDLMQDFTKKLEYSADVVNRTCPEAEWRAYKKAVGTIYFEMFLLVLEPLYKQHPSLKPPNWDT